MQEKQFHSAANGKVSQSPERGFIYLFIFKNKVPILRVQLATDTTLSKQNLGGKLLKVGKKVISIVDLN